MKNKRQLRNTFNRIQGVDMTNVAEEVRVQPEKVDFDSWFVMREDQIPLPHRKEVIKADFCARGLTNKETIDVFDRALNKYGIKLK